MLGFGSPPRPMAVCRDPVDTLSAGPSKRTPVARCSSSLTSVHFAGVREPVRPPLRRHTIASHGDRREHTNTRNKNDSGDNFGSLLQVPSPICRWMWRPFGCSTRKFAAATSLSTKRMNHAPAAASLPQRAFGVTARADRPPVARLLEQHSIGRYRMSVEGWRVMG